MIQIDMPMPTNCLECPACNEYLTCAIPVNGRKWGENDVREFSQSRPEWCPMKEQEAIKPKQIIRKQCKKEYEDGSIDYFAEWYCPHCGSLLVIGFDNKWIQFCSRCGKPILWEAVGRSVK